MPGVAARPAAERAEHPAVREGATARAVLALISSHGDHPPIEVVLRSPNK
jgi:hypothetical protein